MTRTPPQWLQLLCAAVVFMVLLTAIASGVSAHATRGLQQTTASPSGSNITTVTTAEELQSAVSSGNAFIEVVEHLTLASLELINSSDTDLGGKLLGTVPPTVKSITVCCCMLPF